MMDLGEREWIDRFYRSTEHRWIDQDFLRLEVWPRIREEVLIHDSNYTLFGARPFPAQGRLTPPNHVGAGLLLPEKDLPEKDLPEKDLPEKEEGGRETP